MIRSIVVLVVGTALTLVYASGAYLAAGRGGDRALCSCDRITRRWVRLLLGLAGVRVRLDGVDRVDWSGPVVAVANHQSWFDVFTLIATLPGHTRFVAKKELGRIPIFGPAWRRCGHISLDRSDRAKAVESLEGASRKVREDKLTLVLFPEGTRSPDGRLQAFKKGAFVLAIRAGVPIVPIGIAGSRAVMPKGSFRIHPGEIRVRIGEPIPVEGLDHASRNELMSRARAAVAELMEDSDGLPAANPPDAERKTGGLERTPADDARGGQDARAVSSTEAEAE